MIGNQPESGQIRPPCFRLLQRTYTAWDLEAFALDCGYSGPPFRWDQERRFLLRCELDAAHFHLYLGSPQEWGREPVRDAQRGGEEASGEWRVASGEQKALTTGHSPLATRHSPLTATADSPETPNPIANPQLLEMFPTPRDAVAYIMETFPIVKRKDIARTQIKNEAGEVIQPGTYITKDTILAIYDEMQHAIGTGQAYKTKLDPPPGPPTDHEGNFIPVANWDKSNWPPHIHPPRPQSANRGV